ncbi:MAG: nucleotidyltransferase family protein [Candidatus Bathyarchaeia archaeon]
MLSLIVLAAGKSTRMRGRNKLLVKVESRPIIRGVVEAGLKSKVDEVIVVLGWEADKIQKALDDLPCRFVVNKDYEKGQSSSVKAGLREVGGATQAILILPGDVAMIDASSINLVINEYARRKHPIIVAAHKSRPGHPILLDRQLFKEIEQIDEQSFGLKAVVKKHEGAVRFVEAGSSNVLRDVDTPEDLKSL